MVGYCGMPPDWNGVWGGGRRDWRTYGATNETQGWAQTAPMQREMDSVAGSLQLKEEVADAEAPMMARAKAAAPAGGGAGGGEGGPEQPDYA